MSMVDPFDFAILALNSVEKGQVFLASGLYEYKFLTQAEPLAVWIAEGSGGEISVCGGGANVFGVQLQPDGFILIADVASDSTQVYWRAVLKTPLTS